MNLNINETENIKRFYKTLKIYDDLEEFECLFSNKKITNYLSKCRSLVETNAMSQQIGLWALKNKHILNNHIKEVKQGEIIGTVALSSSDSLSL